MDIPIINPTETEKRIWRFVEPKKLGGQVRMDSGTPPARARNTFCYGPRDKTDPTHWDCTLKAGVRASWWAYVTEGANRILDWGCGIGIPAFYLASRGHEVVGVDAGAGRIASAKRYRQEEGPSLPLEYRVIDELGLPFEDGSFDGATSSGSLECLDQPEAFIQELFRVLKPDSPVAFDVGRRPVTIPLGEKTRLHVSNGGVWLHVSVRIGDPFIDRDYAIHLHKHGHVHTRLLPNVPADSDHWSAPVEESGLLLEEVLADAAQAEYRQGFAHNEHTLHEFLTRVGFTDVQFWSLPSGIVFAEQLRTAGILADMPDDISAVCDALVRSLTPQTTPATGGMGATLFVSCKSPATREAD